MSNQEEQLNRTNFLNSIKQVIPKHCENCGHRYNQESLKIIKRTDQTTLLHLQCQECKNAYMINVVSPNNTLQGSSRISINTDLSTSDEVDVFAGKDPISSDLVLKAHEVCKDLTDAAFLKSLM